jgi:hypothetical protein
MYAWIGLTLSMQNSCGATAANQFVRRIHLENTKKKKKSTGKFLKEPVQPAHADLCYGFGLAGLRFNVTTLSRLHPHFDLALLRQLNSPPEFPV